MSSLVFPVTQVYLGEPDPHLDTHKVAQPEVAAQTRSRDCSVTGAIQSRLQKEYQHLRPRAVPGRWELSPTRGFAAPQPG